MKNRIAAIIAVLALVGAVVLFAAAIAQAGGKVHQVVVCKYVGTPGVDEVLQTGQNPIVVDTHALKGFTGSFPYEFADAQGNSIAIRYAVNSHDGDISECPGYVPPTCEETGDCPPPPPVDVCPNLEGDQATVPAGYEVNDQGDCVLIPEPPPCTEDCGPVVPPVVTPPPKSTPDVPKAPTLKQYKQDVQNGAEPGGG